MYEASGKYQGMKTRAFINACFVLAACSSPATCGAASVYFVNLSHEPVYVARQTYVGGRSGASDAGPNESGLGYYENPYFSNTGWAKLEPGESYEGPEDAWYFVKNNKQEFTWSNPVGTSIGVVRDAGFRDVKLYKGQGVPKQLIDQGYRRATYHRYRGNVRYDISGTAYRIASYHKDVSIQSRSFKGLAEYYKVPGKVVNFDYNLNRRWADYKLSRGPDYVYLGGAMEGKQTSIGAARDHAYVRGWIKIYYTVPR